MKTNDHVGSVTAYYFSWSGIKKDARTWGNQGTADKMNIMIISGFGMQI